MELTDRQSEILAFIRTNGSAEVEALSGSFNVTTQTIRRDLAELCDRGLASRTHGGAKRLLSVSNVGYGQRRKIRATEKEKMGEITAGLIPNDCSVALNIGTTTEQVAQALAGHSDLVVLSNNVNIISSLMGAKMKQLILVGGSVRPSDGAIVGEEAVEFISRYKVDYAIIGASALDEDGAILDFDTREVSVARAILKNARTKILVCDNSKFAFSAPVRICHISDLDYFVTDLTPSPSFQAAAREGETQIIVADAS